MQEHKIPIGTLFPPKAQRSEPFPKVDGIPWHSLTPTEETFVRAYFLAKAKMVANQYTKVAILILLVELMLTFSIAIERVLFVTSLVLVVVFVMLRWYTTTWSNVDSTAECTYYPICERYTVRHNSYVTITTDGKTHTYQLNGSCHSKYVMIVNHRGLSCAINSQTLPCDTLRKD